MQRFIWHSEIPVVEGGEIEIHSMDVKTKIICMQEFRFCQTATPRVSLEYMYLTLLS